MNPTPTVEPTLRGDGPSTATDGLRLIASRRPGRRRRWTRSGRSSMSIPRCAKVPWADAGSAWSGCCSRWSQTGPWTRFRSSPRPSWASHDVAIPGLDRMDEMQAYRAMDLLSKPTPTRACRKQCSRHRGPAQPRSPTCCSSTPPAPTSNATPKTCRARRAEASSSARFRRTGAPRTTEDLPQIIMGLAVTSRKGFPVLPLLVLRGTQATRRSFPEVQRRLRRWRLGPGGDRGGRFSGVQGGFGAFAGVRTSSCVSAAGVMAVARVR